MRMKAKDGNFQSIIQEGEGGGGSREEHPQFLLPRYRYATQKFENVTTNISPS